MMSRYLFFLFLLFGMGNAFAQTINVNHATGAATATIPLGGFSYGNISVPISLNYYSTGVKVKDVEGPAGFGWSLSVGGAVTREVRGLPDDYRHPTDTYKYGWLHTSAGTNVHNFTIQNTSPFDCTTTTNDLNYLNTYFSNYTDTEPDLFYVNAPGLSCALVLDKNLQFKAIPYKDIKVTYTVHPTTHSITSFTIVNDEGTTYTFDVTESTNRRTSSTSPSSINIFKTNYEQYKDGVYFSSKWHLRKIEDRNHNYILFTYDVGEEKSSSTPLNIVQAGVGTVSTLYRTSDSYVPMVLRYVTTSFDDVLRDEAEFTYTTSSYSGMPLLSTVKIKYVTYALTYMPAMSTAPGSSPYHTRSFLTKIQSGSGSYSMRCDFDYYGLTHGYYTGSIALPDSLSKKIDYWGYFNGSSATTLVPEVKISPYGAQMPHAQYHVNVSGFSNSDYPYTITGAVRDASVDHAVIGSLKSITNIHGGVAEAEYELNGFYDPQANTSVSGAGLRVKKITEKDQDGTGTVRNFTYNNGKPLALPTMAFVSPNAVSGPLDLQHTSIVVRSETHLSSDPTDVMYGQVTESIPGLGSTSYTFTLPGTAFETSASPDWARTWAYAAKASCASTNYLNNHTNSYPYAPNVNFDFERGLPLSVTKYNTANQRVTQTNYEYARTGTPNIIYGLRYDDHTGSKVYAKYPIFADVDELRVTTTETTYEPITQNQELQQVVEYFYNGTGHKLPTQVKTTNSDGSISRNYTKYIKDYSLTGASDVNSTAMLALKNLNVNAPVEIYSQLERNSVNKTIGASLIKFKSFNFGPGYDLYLPSQQLGLLAAAGLTDFQPSTITSGNFVNDSRYEILANNTEYTPSGILVSSNNNKNYSTTVLTDMDTRKPVAVFKNAKPDEVLCTMFDNWSYRSSFISYGTPAATLAYTSHTGKYGLSITSANTLSGQVTKALHSDNYVFSIWIASTSAGTLQLDLVDASTAVTSHTLPFTNSSGAYKRYMIKVPVGSISTTFTARFSCNVSVDIDDVLFYPEMAEVQTITYSYETKQKTSETNDLGITTYYDYDSFNRPGAIRDQDKNLIKAYQYSYYAYDYQYSANNSYVNTAKSGTFTKNDCSSGTGGTVTYTIPAGRFGAPTQAQADSLANDALAAGGQAYANRNGTCTPGNASISYTNYCTTVHAVKTGGVSELKIKNGSGVVLYTYSEGQLLSGITVPQGSYIFEYTTYGSLYSPVTGNGWGSINLVTPTYSADFYALNDGSSTTYNVNVVLNESAYDLYVFTNATVSRQAGPSGKNKGN